MVEAMRESHIDMAHKLAITLFTSGSTITTAAELIALYGFATANDTVTEVSMAYALLGTLPAIVGGQYFVGRALQSNR